MVMRSNKRTFEITSRQQVRLPNQPLQDALPDDARSPLDEIPPNYWQPYRAPCVDSAASPAKCPHQCAAPASA